eukprot:CAMPEP_0195270774 /NCGR_PEP_ID=MMETSP0706-20130129/14579_1 /TAXON_ID=33640 /ORGANISM="Asterionellopsis glacialis, Strain CCMP134" /LENGTH=219 /DNA_ID=CAMNT_0040326167 /DNA_START=111 /DNA_END=770 /DNA_ORIENTATION=+
MMYRTKLLAVMTMLLPSLFAVAAEDSTATSFLRKVIYGEQQQPQGGPLDCALSGATDSASCTGVSTENGETCVWCTAGGAAAGPGVCVTPEQADSVKRFGFQCGKDDSSGDDDDDDDDDDAAGDDDDAAGDDKAPSTDDDFHMDDLLGCLMDGDDSKDCSSSSHGCVWCTSKLYGVCITKQASETIAEYKLFDCATQEDEEEEDLEEEKENIAIDAAAE